MAAARGFIDERERELELAVLAQHQPHLVVRRRVVGFDLDGAREVGERGLTEPVVMVQACAGPERAGVARRGADDRAQFVERSGTVAGAGERFRAFDAPFHRGAGVVDGRRQRVDGAAKVATGSRTT